MIGAAMLVTSACDTKVEGYCPYGKSRTLMLLDRTTPYDETDRANLNDGLVRLAGSLGVGDELVIRTITDTPATSAQVFDKCRPGCPPQGVTDWLFSGCRTVVARRDYQQFEKDLVASILPLTHNAESYKHSEIIRTVSSVTADYPAKHFERVVVFTDLLENSPSVLPFPSITSLPAEEMLGRVANLDIQPALAGAEVTVFGFGRAHDPDRTALAADLSQRVRKFWNAYFKSGGAADVRIGQNLRVESGTD